MENNNTERVTQKSVPMNIEAEVGILNCILIDPVLLDYSLDQVAPEDFFDPKNKGIYQAFINIKNKALVPDIQLLISNLEETNKMNEVGGLEYLNQILNYNYSTANIDSYLNLVKDSSLKRKTIDSLNDLSQQGYDPSIKVNDYLDKVEQTIFNLSQTRRTTDFRTLSQVAQEVQREADDKNNETSDITGLNTGFKNLNQLTLGLQNGNLIILAARPAMGKSAYALNLALNVARKNNATVAFFSLEMPAEQLVKRLFAADTSIELSSINKGRLSDTEWKSFATSARNFETTRIYFDDSSMNTIGDIRSKCRKLKSGPDGLDLIVIDYLQLISMSGKVNSQNEGISQISRGLKLLARELEIPVIALAQLSRNVEHRDDKRPIMADLRDSGSIEQDADIVAFLYREEYYTHKRPGECDLIVAKNRQGSTATLKYLFEGKFQKFTDNGEEENS
jgi:replicative DNA helicase